MRTNEAAANNHRRSEHTFAAASVYSTLGLLCCRQRGVISEPRPLSYEAHERRISLVAVGTSGG